MTETIYIEHPTGKTLYREPTTAMSDHRHGEEVVLDVPRRVVEVNDGYDSPRRYVYVSRPVVAAEAHRAAQGAD